VDQDSTVAIVFSDITRPTPHRQILPPLLEQLSAVPDAQILFINGLGTHRPNTEQELEEILGREILARFDVLQHDARDEGQLVSLGISSQGHDIRINRHFLDCSVRILTGYIEPHLFAGISGGPKAILPAIAGVDSIYANHGAGMIGALGVGFARTEGNPIWEEMMEAARMAGPSFLLNVTQTEARKITGVFAGDLQAAHRAGIQFLKRSALVPVREPFDVVLTTAGGYPLDISMYQSVKGMAVAEQIVKPGGAILLAAECSEGMPPSGEYGQIMALASSPDEMLEMLHRPDFFMQDQWDAQIQARICQRVEFLIYSDGLTDEQVRAMFAEPVRDVEARVRALLERHGPSARLAVLPAGPLAVPYLQGEED
jgi:nickel-dependent lactate racemase